MFDQVPNKKEPGLPDDMFAGVDKAPAPQSAPAAPSPMMAPPAPVRDASGVPDGRAPQTMNAADLPPAPVDHGMGAGKVVAIILVALGVLSVSGYFAYSLMIQPSMDDGVVDAVSDELSGEDEDDQDGKGENEDEIGDDEAESDEDEEEEETEPEQTPASLLDSDGDGLTNAEELENGTSMTKSDTDGDGLGDREEVEVYETDPKDPDSDGDTFLDGAEVSNGYDPNGTGRLFTVPEDDTEEDAS